MLNSLIIWLRVMRVAKDPRSYRGKLESGSIWPESWHIQYLGQENIARLAYAQRMVINLFRKYVHVCNASNTWILTSDNDTTVDMSANQSLNNAPYKNLRQAQVSGKSCWRNVLGKSGESLQCGKMTAVGTGFGRKHWSPGLFLTGNWRGIPP